MFVRIGLIGLAAVAAAVFYWASAVLNALPRKVQPDQLDVAIAAPVQLMLTGGDRFLAANAGAVRLIVLNVMDLDKRDYPILGLAHANTAFLNPCHEDNYYVGQAFLPWIGEFEAADTVLRVAADCRTWDAMPGYFRAFNAFYFRKDYTRAARLYEETAARADENQRNHLLFMASKFYEKSEDLDARVAAAVIRGLQQSTGNPQLKAFLEARARRVEIVAELRDAVKRYDRRFAKPPADLPDLVRSGVLATLPDDPLGKGFRLDERGLVQPIN